MGKKAVVVLLVGLAFPSLRLAQAQQQAKIPKIGVLRAQPASSPAPSNELFLRAFRELGYFEGKNIAFETRSAEGKLDRFPALADELVRLKVDVLVAYSTSAALAAKNAAGTIPIVFLNVSDPVASGLVDSLARPGETSRGSPALIQCWLASDWSYSRKPFPTSPAWWCCGIHRIEVLRSNGTKANSPHENWVCNLTLWR